MRFFSLAQITRENIVIYIYIYNLYICLRYSNDNSTNNKTLLSKVVLNQILAFDRRSGSPGLNDSTNSFRSMQARKEVPSPVKKIDSVSLISS